MLRTKVLPVTEFPLASVTEITTWVTGLPLASVQNKCNYIGTHLFK